MADLTPEPACAPCVVVVGPANSGKTTFLHLLDQAQQQHPDLPLVYIVKGTPDGTGRGFGETSRGAPSVTGTRARAERSWCNAAC